MKIFNLKRIKRNVAIVRLIALNLLYITHRAYRQG